MRVTDRLTVYLKNESNKLRFRTLNNTLGENDWHYPFVKQRLSMFCITSSCEQFFETFTGLFQLASGSVMTQSSLFSHYLSVLNQFYPCKLGSALPLTISAF